MARARHCRLAIKIYDPYGGNLESMYLSEASNSLGTSVTTMSRVHVVDVVLSSKIHSLGLKHHISQLLEILVADSSQLGPFLEGLLLAKESPLTQGAPPFPGCSPLPMMG